MAFRSSMLVLLVALALCGTCHGATAGAAAYKVGGQDGWIVGVVDYNQWSSSKEFHVGDTLLFSYNMYHNVYEVNKQGYESCDASSPFAAYSSGSDTIKLERPGHYYFLCGVPGHCDAGQKVDVVVSSLPTPADSPVISPSPAPSPLTPHTPDSPVSSPTPTPSALPSPATPSPAPSALSSPAVYKVGGPGGWIIGLDYKQWSSTNEFHVGDSLLFAYNNYHNVMEVTEQGFKSCNSTSPMAAYSSGADYITLERPGHYYFLCGAPGHCEAGQKVEVMVSLPTADVSVSSPTPAPSGLPSPSTSAPSALPSPPHSSALTIDAPTTFGLAVLVLVFSKLMLF